MLVLEEIGMAIVPDSFRILDVHVTDGTGGKNDKPVLRYQIHAPLSNSVTPLSNSRARIIPRYVGTSESETLHLWIQNQIVLKQIQPLFKVAQYNT